MYSFLLLPVYVTLLLTKISKKNIFQLLQLLESQTDKPNSDIHKLLLYEDHPSLFWETHFTYTEKVAIGQLLNLLIEIL